MEEPEEVTILDMLATAKQLWSVLAALPKHDRYKPYYWDVETAYAYIAGYQMEQRWSNTTRCFDAYTNATYRERPAFKESLSKNVSDF